MLGYFTYYTSIYDRHERRFDDEELLLGKADNANREFGNTHRHLVENSVGFYAQDDWKIRPRLTLNFGLRYDINGNVRDRNNQEANFFPDRGLVQVGQGINGSTTSITTTSDLTWASPGTFSATAGRPCVGAILSLTMWPISATLASPYSFGQADAGLFTQPNLGNVSVSNLGDVAAAISRVAPNDPAATCYDPNTGGRLYLFRSRQSIGPSSRSTHRSDAFSVVNDFKTPCYHNFNVSLQNELFRNNVLTVTYSGQRGEICLINRDLERPSAGQPERTPTRPSSGANFRISARDPDEQSGHLPVRQPADFLQPA